MIALWISWFCLLFAIIIAYVLLMDQDAWRVHFAQFDDTGQRIAPSWHKSRVMLVVIRILLGCSALALLMHFVLPAQLGEIAPTPPNNTKNDSNQTFFGNAPIRA